MATMWYNYLQGDLFERFCSDDLLTPSYILRGTQSNCVVRALPQWSSGRCEWWEEQTSHASICILVTQCTCRLASEPLCVYPLQLWRAVSVCPPVSAGQELPCAQLGLTTGCHGNPRRLWLMVFRGEKKGCLMVPPPPISFQSLPLIVLIYCGRELSKWL